MAGFDPLFLLGDNALLQKLRALKEQVDSVGGQTILQQIDEKKFDLLARNIGFDGVQGSYYERLSVQVLLPESLDARLSANR